VERAGVAFVIGSPHRPPGICPLSVSGWLLSGKVKNTDHRVGTGEEMERL
jgi:hypothetical protein